MDANRYQRQINFTHFNAESQGRLRKASVLICGCGGLGCVLAQWLVRAGVGKIRIVDSDTVAQTNLHRQILYTENGVGKPKLEMALAALAAMNSEVSIETVSGRLTADNADALAEGMDLLLDATDNYAARSLLNETSLRRNLPWIYAGVAEAQGQVLTIFPHETPCLKCLIPDLSTGLPIFESGVLGPAVGVIGSFEAMEAIKILSGHRDAVSPFLTTFDLWNHRFSSISLAELPSCGCRKNHE
ncbi:MAG: HesA/MoeB/ThiF family protein [Planctomycetia bacterium]|nr:HesA/MoeB/ThiF family protein [Planctomycetia bacterium]